MKECPGTGLKRGQVFGLASMEEVAEAVVHYGQYNSAG